jgi:hypothetical protein
MSKRIENLNYARKKHDELVAQVASMDPIQMERDIGEMRMVFENLLKRLSMTRDQWEVFNMIVGKHRAMFDVYVPRN